MNFGKINAQTLTIIVGGLCLLIGVLAYMAFRKYRELQEECNQQTLLINALIKKNQMLEEEKMKVHKQLPPMQDVVDKEEVVMEVKTELPRQLETIEEVSENTSDDGCLDLEETQDLVESMDLVEESHDLVEDEEVIFQETVEKKEDKEYDSEDDEPAVEESTSEDDEEIIEDDEEIMILKDMVGGVSDIEEQQGINEEMLDISDNEEMNFEKLNEIYDSIDKEFDLEIQDAERLLEKIESGEESSDDLLEEPVEDIVAGVIEKSIDDVLSELASKQKQEKPKKRRGRKPKKSAE